MIHLSKLKSQLGVWFIGYTFSLLLCGNPSIAQQADVVNFKHRAWTPKTIQACEGNIWPQYRGLDGDGLASDQADPPLQWSYREDLSKTRNVRWRTPLEGRAWSSPIVFGNRIWLTNADDQGLHQSLVGLDRLTGEIVRNQTLITNEQVQPDYHLTNSYASCTPVCDEAIVYCHFGAYGTLAVDSSKPIETSIIWQRHDLPCNHYRGPGSSPILFEDLLILQFDGYDFQYVVGLDRETGKTRWRHERAYDFRTENGDMRKAFATPQIISVEGQLQLISPAARGVEALNPQTGELIWTVRYDEHSSAARPLFDGNYIYLNTGFSKSKLIAIDPRGSGDLTDTNIRWTVSKGVGSKPTPILFSGWIVSIEDRGVVTAFDKQTGQVVWQHRLGGNFSASPVATKDRLYLFDESGHTYVIAASKQFELLQENALTEGCMASPAIVNEALIVRTTAAVYCLSDEESP